MASASMSGLSLIQLCPDREAFARWVGARGWLGREALRQGNPDLGYAWHALLKSALGELAPKPFVDRIPLRANQLLGYISADLETIRSALRADALAAQALGLDLLRLNDMPSQWRIGQQLSFEVRARPVVRTRTATRTGAIDEIDVAPHRARTSPELGREQAYADWLRKEFARGEAAKLETVRMSLFRRTRVLRRNQDETRTIASVEGPEAWLCGRLTIVDPAGFAALLRRGIGRHRAFGFGCVLVARPGLLE